MEPLSKYLTYFSRTRTNILKFIWKHKRPQIDKAILRKKNGAGRIRLPDFRQGHSHQNSMLLAQKQKYRSMEQDEKPRNMPYTSGQLLYNRRGKLI